MNCTHYPLRVLGEWSFLVSMKSHLFLAILCGAISADALEPKFEAETIDSEIEVGYGLAIADVDGDGKD